MPIQVKIKTYNFVDEEGTMIPDAKYTVRTRISHDAQQKYMAAISTQIPDLTDAIEDGRLKEGFKPDITAATIDEVTRILLSDGLIGLEGVLDVNGAEIHHWEAFIKHDAFYVSQVIKVLQASALTTQAPNPNESAPSVER